MQGQNIGSQGLSGQTGLSGQKEQSGLSGQKGQTTTSSSQQQQSSKDRPIVQWVKISSKSILDRSIQCYVKHLFWFTV